MKQMQMQHHQQMHRHSQRQSYLTPNNERRNTNTGIISELSAHHTQCRALAEDGDEEDEHSSHHSHESHESMHSSEDEEDEEEEDDGYDTHTAPRTTIDETFEVGGRGDRKTSIQLTGDDDAVVFGRKVDNKSRHSVVEDTYLKYLNV